MSGCTAIGCTDGRIGFGTDRWLTAIGLFTYRQRQRQFRQQWHTQLRGYTRPATFTEQVTDMTTFRALMHTHIFDDTQNWNIDFGKHFDTFGGVEQGDVLRGGHNNRTGNWHFPAGGRLFTELHRLAWPSCARAISDTSVSS